jgi:biopolymer transport protein ExbD
MRAAFFAIVPLLLCLSSPTSGADEKVAKLTAQVLADDKGKIAKITLRGDGIAKEIDFKADVEALAKKLKELAEKHKDKLPALVLEIDEKLLQADVVRLVDAAIEAGFKDASPVPLDPKKR